MAENVWIKWVLGGLVIFCIIAILYVTNLSTAIGDLHRGFWWAIDPLIILITYMYLTRKQLEMRQPLDAIRVIREYMKRQSSGIMRTVDFIGTDWNFVEMLQFYGVVVLRGKIAFVNTGRRTKSDPYNVYQTVTWGFDMYNKYPSDKNSVEKFFIRNWLNDKEVEKLCKIGAPATKAEGALEELAKKSKEVKEFKEAVGEIEE